MDATDATSADPSESDHDHDHVHVHVHDLDPDPDHIAEDVGDNSIFVDAAGPTGHATSLDGHDGDEDAQVEQDETGNLAGVQETEQVDEENASTKHSSPSPLQQPQLLPIQVLLHAPADPSSYSKIDLPPSWFVSKILEEVATGHDNDDDDGPWYSVEFDDGRIDQFAYDDIRTMRNGSSALDRFRRSQGFYQEQDMYQHPGTIAHHGTKRHWPADTDSDHMEFEQPRQIPLRRSTRRMTSRQPSVDYPMKYGIDEDLVDSAFVGGDDHEDEDDDDFDNPVKQGLGPNKRLTRAQNSVGKKYTAHLLYSEDELAGDSDDNFKPVTSDLSSFKAGHKRKGGKGRRSLRGAARRRDRDSSIEFEPTRKSGRITKDTNYVVPDIDDDYGAIDDKPVSTPKHVSVKEIFPPLPEDSEFVKSHMRTCETCGSGAHAGKGSLIACQGCSTSYHKICLGQRSAREHRVTKIGPDYFVLQCRICIGTYQKKDATAPNHALCQTCKAVSPSCHEFSPKKTPKVEEHLRQENGGQDPVTEVNRELINNAATLLFRCTSCKRGYHFEHLPPLTREEEIPVDLRANRISEYDMVDWRCKDCVDAKHKIQSLVAWRPVDQEGYITGKTCLDIPEDGKEYLVKWDKVSHFHDTWMPGAWVFGVAASAMKSAFVKRDENMLPKMTFEQAIEEEWLLADVILNVRYRGNRVRSSKAKDLARISDVKEIFVKFQGLGYTESVWDTPPAKDTGAAYDAFRTAYEEYVQGVHFPHVTDHKMAERVKQFRGLDFRSECELHAQPPGLKRGKLMEYQVDGVNWMLFNFNKQLNVILADEMGLGKTVQVVAFITTLVQDKPNCWPFLIVVPNSTCPNWRRELRQWSPELRVCTYHGGKAAQDLAFKHEIFPEGIKAGIKAHVVIMSYEAAVDAGSTFRSVKWQGLIVDEGQRLKNDKSLLYRALQDMRIPFRVLLTGTPLQNNKRELFNLLQFIDPSRNAEALDEEYREVTNESLRKLHAMIRPYFLRRTKIEVLTFLPPMAQIILPVTMTYLQEKLSKSIISKNSELIKAIVSKGKIKAGERKGLNNILMELRRVLCHPFLFSDSVEDRTVTDPVIIQKNLVDASGKLRLLNIMLPKLRERGHRVLIFSQFLMSLTILEDFLTALGLPHARIDGSLSALEKQKRIDAFNEPGSLFFAMLLSTRAGGVGINLATADTVIIFDPDFNPHQDIQALSRAHRIGQKNKVLCFQLTTKDTVEEKIMQIGRKKMALDHALIESMDAADEAGEKDLESILKHGAEALFSGDAQDKIVYDEASVDKLLDRSQIESTSTGNDKSTESQFSFARVWANDKATLTANIDDDANESNGPTDSNVWENILKQREEEHQQELAKQHREYGRGARRRAQDVRYDAVGGYIEGINDDFLTEHQSQIQGDLELDASTESDFNAKESEGSDAEEEEAYSKVSPKSRARKALAPDVVTLLDKPLSPPPPPPRLPSLPRDPLQPRKRGRPRKPVDQLTPSNRMAAKVQKPPHPNQSLTTSLRNPQLPLTMPPIQQSAVPEAPTYLQMAPQPMYKPLPAQHSTSLSMSLPTNNGWGNPSSTVPQFTPTTNQNPLVSSWSRLQQPPAGYHNLPDRAHSFQHINTPNYQTNPATSLPSGPAPTNMTLVSNIQTMPHTNLATNLTLGQNGIERGVPCIICGESHAFLACVDLNSELSLRIAIDCLRPLKADSDRAFKEQVREQLRQRLKVLTKNVS
ncbi:hypothetical protein BKA67DRAFT_561021 [Truncatella angustata]|uniref:Uncharacterized protein n=1 Tax=Truncatella angustata TaxID=152316 RepID=A0A9P8UNW4_9PEZI|nr:uncharacterized protein BKA67DRAFT_561021 [Truncatella angustata]KAH6655543.1 hypothetical protein BKA67DRAFT_561021 [Truncatella angustata]